MLFMGIITWEPGNRDKVRKAFVTPGSQTGKTIGVWSDIGGCRAFRLFEADDARAMCVAANFWNDVATLEIIPVMESQDLMRVVASKN